MMGKTHVAVGIACAALVCRPGTPAQWANAALAGAMGGLISDIDVRAKSRRGRRDVLYSRLVVAFIALTALVVNWMFAREALPALRDAVPLRAAAGAGAFLLLCLLGRVSGHRGFTHSLLAMALFCAALYPVSPALLPGFAAGFLSHLALDLCNKKPIRLFFPFGKGVCLKLCYADGAADTAAFVAAIAALASKICGFLRL